MTDEAEISLAILDRKVATYVIRNLIMEGLSKAQVERLVDDSGFFEYDDAATLERMQERGELEHLIELLFNRYK